MGRATRGREAVVIAITLLAAFLAGCISPASELSAQADVGAAVPIGHAGLTKPVLLPGKFLSFKVVSFDGTRLHVDVQLPDAPGPFPTLVDYTPYSILGEQRWALGKENAVVQAAGNFSLGLANYYVPRGYAVAVAHVRGTGESEGCLTVGGPEEGKDGYEIVEAIAKQTWSSGKVALMGTSWVGTTPIETAVFEPPHLTTILPISSVSSWYTYYFENGVQRINGDPPPGSSSTDPAFDVALSWTPGVRTSVAEPAEEIACTSEFTRKYYVEDDYDDYWKARNHALLSGKITVPVLYAQGFKDENVATDMIPQFFPLVTSEKRAFYGQHAHGVPGSRQYFTNYTHRWLDHFMLGLENGVLETPIVQVEDNLGKWRGEADWPPKDVNVSRLWFAGENRLQPTAPTARSVSFTDDGQGSEDANLEGVNHVTFASGPLDVPMHVAGAPRTHLEAATDLADTNFAVLVYDGAPDGTKAFLTRGYIDARHRNGLEKGEDLVSGARYEVEWDLHPRDHVVAAGHRIVVVVKSSDAYVFSDEEKATNTLFFGADGSWIDVPLVNDTPRTYLDAATVPSDAVD